MTSTTIESVKEFLDFKQQHQPVCRIWHCATDKGTYEIINYGPTEPYIAYIVEPVGLNNTIRKALDSLAQAIQFCQKHHNRLLNG